MRGTKLDYARLDSALLLEADLCGATLRGETFTQLECDDNSFVNIDFSEVNGLESVQHYGPSSIGIDTLYKSHGKIPAQFLRGCGVPENFITYLPSLIGTVKPIEYQSCFISHSTKDDEFV